MVRKTDQGIVRIEVVAAVGDARAVDLPDEPSIRGDALAQQLARVGTVHGDEGQARGAHA